MKHVLYMSLETLLFLHKSNTKIVKQGEEGNVVICSFDYLIVSDLRINGAISYHTFCWTYKI